MTLNDAQRIQLQTAGYVLLPGVLTEAEIGRLSDHLEQLWAAEGTDASLENYIEPGVRRLANLANKGALFRPIFAHPLVLEAMRLMMGPTVRLSMLNARDALPHAGSRQIYHCDTDHKGKPDEQGFWVGTAVWMLDNFTAENGATRLVPKSHLTGQLPKEVMDDLFAPHPDEIILTGQRGDVLIFNGHCWHAGGANGTDAPRRAILAHYLRAGIPRPESRRQYLSPDAIAQLTAVELDVLGLDEI